MAQTVDLESVALVETRDDASRARVRPPNGMRPHVRLAVALIALASLCLLGVSAGNTRPGISARLGAGAVARKRGHLRGFPMVRALVAPGQEATLKVVENNWEAYHANGRDALVPLYLPDVSLWPDGGGFAELSAVIGGERDLEEGTVISYLKMLDRKHAQAELGYEPDEHHERQKLVPAALVDGMEDFASASLGHLAAWLEAKKLKKKSLIVNDWKTLIANHMGPPEDFDSFIMSFLNKGPKKWDVLFLDKGERGVDPEALKKPFATFRNDEWSEPYLVFRNRAAGVAGASFYMVSESFLKKVPSLLAQFQFTAVDGWLSTLCRDGHLKCFSHMRRDWFFGFTPEHLKGHHPPDARVVPTAELLFEAGGVIRDEKTTSAFAGEETAKSEEAGEGPGLGTAKKAPKKKRERKVSRAAALGWAPLDASDDKAH